MNEILKQLKGLKTEYINPSPDWVSKNRSVLVAQIKNSASSATAKQRFNLNNFWLLGSIFLPQNFVFKVVRPVVAILMIIGLGSGSWIATVAASQDSLPGEWLYQAKRATEKTQMVAAVAVGAKETETKLRVGFAKRRAVETKQLIQSQDPKKMERVSDVVNDLKQEMTKVGHDLDDIKNQDDGKNISAVSVKNVGKETNEITAILEQAESELEIASVSSTSEKIITDGLAETKVVTKETNVKAVEVMVEKHLQGDTSVSKEEVKEAINDQVNSDISNMEVNKRTVDQVSRAVEDAVKVMSQGKTPSDSSVGASSVSSTPTINGLLSASSSAKMTTSSISSNQNLKEKVAQVNEQTKQAVSEMQKVSDVVSQKATEATQMLSTDNFAEAIKLIKQVSDVSNLADKTAGQTVKAMQQVAPMVAAVQTAINASSSTTAGQPALMQNAIQTSNPIGSTTPTLPTVSAQ
ncbi:MAG: hypothetical protein ABH832_02950 [bacterium]